MAPDDVKWRRNACPLSIVTIILLLHMAVTLSGCTAPTKDYTAFHRVNPKSILIIPAINRSVEVNAPDYFLPTLVRPVAERGYYAFPVNIVKRLLEDDGLSDATLVHQADPRKLAAIFGADAILYMTIERWDARYVVLHTQVTTEFTYVLKSGATGEELWRTTEKKVYTTSGTSTQNPIISLISAAVTAAATRAVPDYEAILLAKEANAFAVGRKHSGLPSGPYNKEYKQDVK